MSIREAKLYEVLGRELTTGVDGFNILDVGCGSGMTASRLLADIQTNVCYTSIDQSTYPTKVSHPMVKHDHFMLDIFQNIPPLPQCYDVVLIDIEPHGKEIEVYEKIKHVMKPSHLCILKHVCYIDLYGSYHADKFIGKYYDGICAFLKGCAMSLF